MRFRWCLLSYVLLLWVASPMWGAEPFWGQWDYRSPEMSIFLDLRANGTFSLETATPGEKEVSEGTYRVVGLTFSVFPQKESPLFFSWRMPDANTLVLVNADGDATKMARRAPPGSALQGTSKAEGSPEAPAHAPASGGRPTMLMHRVWEPKERAFSFLLPEGWQVEGGIFNVNPMETNGPGNSISPKCDLTIKKDTSGRVLLRAVPTWNYADLTYAPTGWGSFPPGSWYQGMLSRPMPDPRAFLLGVLRDMHPQAADVKVLVEDPMPEVNAAFEKAAASLNATLGQIGVEGSRFNSLAMMVEYVEGGVRFREVLATTIADLCRSAFMWSNENTVVFRAPAAEFEGWKPVFDAIRSSRQMNPEWVAAVTKAMGERAKLAWETQQYINRVNEEIVENRRRTNAEIRHEDWLFISGQEEYANPFTGQAERDTSAWRYRWVNERGDLLYSDEQGFDPNTLQQYAAHQWKLTPVRER